MPDSPAEQEPPRDELGNPTPADGTDGQDQEAPTGHCGKTFIEHFRESMEEHAEPGRLPAES